MKAKERIIQMVEEFVTYDAEVTRESKITDLRIDYEGMTDLKDGINSEYDINMTVVDMFGSDWENATVGELVDNVLKRLGRLK